MKHLEYGAAGRSIEDMVGMYGVAYMERMAGYAGWIMENMVDARDSA
ncbi:hypothetical protein [Paenibacillus sp. YN15]|nr:hypothetical protein [Paenibacillus sp. YN15]